MIFRQLFDSISSTYTYLIASRHGGEAIILDPVLEKAMGRPFDFASMRNRDDLPEEFQIEDYLTISSVVNTVYSRFGVPAQYHRKTGRDTGAAPVLQGLLT